MAIALTDVLALELALVIVRLGIRRLPIGINALMVVGPIVWVAIFAAFRLYDLRRLSPAEEFRRTLEAVTVGVFAVAIVVRGASAFIFERTATSGLSLAWMGRTWIVALLLVFATRQLWHKYMWHVRKRGDLAYRTLIVGANEEAARIGQVLSTGGSGFQPVGFVRTGGDNPAWDGLPVVGSVDDLGSAIEGNGVECVFVASSAVGPELMKTVIKNLRRQDVEVRVSANMTEILSSRLTVQPVGELLALSLRPARLSGGQALMKRTFDLVLATVAIVLTSPVWLVSILLIRLSSRGPIFYRQERIGREGRPFRMIKFRTMVQGADQLVRELEERQDGDGPLFKIRNDHRITRVGRWLRKWSVDELPQLLNVLKGEMSLVGPRPMPAIFDESYYADWHRGRLEVPPGITGLWQVSGRSDMTWDECVRLDLFYIENWSIAYDLFILAKTIPAVFSHRGAF